MIKLNEIFTLDELEIWELTIRKWHDEKELNDITDMQEWLELLSSAFASELRGHQLDEETVSVWFHKVLSSSRTEPFRGADVPLPPEPAVEPPAPNVSGSATTKTILAEITGRIMMELGKRDLADVDTASLLALSVQCAIHTAANDGK